MTKRKKKKIGLVAAKDAGLIHHGPMATSDATATPDIARAIKQINNLLRLMPAEAINVSSSGSLESRELHNWDVVAPAILCSAANCMLSLRLLAETPVPCREQDAGMLLRRVYEHLVLFAWIAINPEANAKRWVADDYKYRILIHDELKCELLDDTTYKAFVDYKTRNKPMPNLLVRATEADAYWLPQLSDKTPSLVSLYTTIYRATSANVHPTPRSLFAYVNPGGATGNFAIGLNTRSPVMNQSAYVCAPAAFAMMLLVAEKVLKFPSAAQVYKAYAIDPITDPEATPKKEG